MDPQETPVTAIETVINQCKTCMHHIYEIARENYDVISQPMTNTQTVSTLGVLEQLRMDYRSLVVRVKMIMRFALVANRMKPYQRYSDFLDHATLQSIFAQAQNLTNSICQLRTAIKNHPKVAQLTPVGRYLTLSGIGLLCIGGILFIPAAIPVGLATGLSLGGAVSTSVGCLLPTTLSARDINPVILPCADHLVESELDSDAFEYTATKLCELCGEEEEFASVSCISRFLHINRV